MGDQLELAAATMTMTIKATITTTIKAVATTPVMTPARAMPSPCSPVCRISRRARCPMTIATGPASEHTSSEAMPRTKATMALLLVGGAAVAYVGVVYGVPGEG